MNKQQTIYLSFVMSYLLISPTIFAQEVGGPVTEEQAEKIGKDLLLDIPISNAQATKSAQKAIQAEQEPVGSSLYFYTMPNETKPRLAWNVSFGDPVNKEVFVDAMKGDVLSVKSTSEPSIESIIQRVLQKPLYIASTLIASVCVLLVIIIIWRKRKNKKTKWRD